jgi:(R,R)-butanediol dehydrogenase/meso-butanediol dehydrogenase/diacetyl reductase
MQVQAAVFTGESDPLEVRKIDVPEPAANELLLKVGACGICGSDLHAVQTGFVPAGTVMGHEFAGEVVAVGEDAQKQWSVGDRVIAAPILTCGECPECLDGDLMSCRNAVLVGLDETVTGAYAEVVRVQAGAVIRIPECDDSSEVSWQDAAIYEPLSVGFSAYRTGAVAIGEDVLVLGGGPIGISLIKWARYFGVTNIAVSEPEPVRRQRAGDAGANVVIDPGECDNPVEEFQRQTGTVPKVIFECVGRPGILQSMIDMAAPGTRLVAVGTGMEPEEVTVVTAALKKLSLTFAFGWELDDARYVLDSIAAGDIDTTGLVSATVSLDELPAMFSELMRPNTHCKVMVTPG